MAENTTYYWRIDEVKPNGGTTSGKVWSFTTSALPAYLNRDYRVDLLDFAILGSQWQQVPFQRAEEAKEEVWH